MGAGKYLLKYFERFSVIICLIFDVTFNEESWGIKWYPVVWTTWENIFDLESRFEKILERGSMIISLRKSSKDGDDKYFLDKYQLVCLNVMKVMPMVMLWK